MSVLRWLRRVFTNNASYLAYVTERNLVTLSLQFCSRDSLLRLPNKKALLEIFIFSIKAVAMAISDPWTGSNFVIFGLFS